MEARSKSHLRSRTLAGPPYSRRTAMLIAAFRSIVPLLLLGFGLLVSRADDFWKHKPAAQWSSSEALKLVHRSPWARQEVVVFLRIEEQAAYSVTTGTHHCDPDAIDASGKCLQKRRVEAPIDSSRQPDGAPQLTPSSAILVRWESAPPVAQAFVRLQELGEHAVIEFQAPAPRLPRDRYVITAKVEQAGFAGFEPFAVTPAGKPVLHATLKTRRGSVAPLEIEFTGTGASSAAHFFFPRTLDGAALLGPERDSADFYLQGRNFAIHSKFTIDSESLQ